MQQPPSLTAPTLHKPLHSKVSNYLNDQRRTGQYCDLIIELGAGENSAFCHYCVVGAQSNFIGGTHFQQLQFSIRNPLKVTINDFSCSQCLQTMIDFFYEDVVSIAKEHEEHFRKLAKILAVTELQNIFHIKEVTVSPTAVTAENVSEPCANGEITTGETACLGTAEEVFAKPDDINLKIDNIFDEPRNYFKLTNPRAAGSSSKINYCIGCDFKCYRVPEMIGHMTSCEPSHMTCSLCEVGFLGWREHDAHLRKHSQDMRKPFFCLECDVRFATRAAWMLHHPKHSTEAPHLCPHCGKGFKWKQGLHSHLLVHNKEKQMLCDVCGYSTTHIKSLKSHKLQHTGESFPCTFDGCKHRANRKENLKLHMETHKQERPFVCEVCGYKFSHSKNLKRHAFKHSIIDIKKYKCQLCSFSSHRSDKVKEHTQRVHTEKVVQLELPEIVENAFENNVADEFDLPMLAMEKAELAAAEVERSKAELDSKIQKPKRSRKNAEHKLAVERRLKPLLPNLASTTTHNNNKDKID